METVMDMDLRLLEGAKKSVIWDIAVGCLALSVKVRSLHFTASMSHER
jgi:hypothetical protein